MKYIHYPILLLAFMLGCNLFIACDDDDAGGQPVIHCVRLTDPTKTDSTFTDVHPGSMIVVIGENLTDVKKVFINDQQISFNTNYGTSTNLILTIPAELKLTGAHPELTGELRIETSHGTAVYALHVLSPAPYITRVATTFPVETGTPLRVFGGNFYEIERIYFTTAEEDIENAPVAVEVKEYTVNNDFDLITFNAPAGLIEKGTLVIDCYTADAFTPFRRSALPPVINRISSMMPITGTTVTILGQNFMDIASITMGNRQADLSTMEVSEENDCITFTMPRAPQGTCTLAVTTMGGTAEVSGFYPSENVVLNYDNIGYFAWGGQAASITADGSAAPYFSDGACYRLSGEIPAWNWWWGQLQNTAVWDIDAAFLPADTPTADLFLQFECYVAMDYDEGPVFRFYLKGNEGHNLTNYRPVSDFTGKMEVGQWMQCSIPLSSLVDEATWGDFQRRDGSELAIQMTNPTGNGPFNLEFYFDNFRVVTKK